jgi:aminoglycoside phosphotransferase (APT) family kinase protein
MDINWERTIPYCDIEQNVVRKIFDAYKSDCDIASIELLPGGKRNSNYKVQLKGDRKKYLLRVYCEPDNTWSRELGIHRRMREQIPVPEVIFGDFNHEIFELPYAVFEFIDGMTLDHCVLREAKPINKDMFYSLGRELAEVHSIKYDTVGFIDGDMQVTLQLPPVIEWYDMFLEGTAARKLGAALAEKIRRAVNDNCSVLNTLDQDARLVHGDFRPTNIIVCNDGSHRIIDWEFAMAGHPVSDLGQFLRYEEQVNEQNADAFISGYENGAGCDFSTDLKKTVLLRDLINLIQMLNCEQKKPYKDADLIRLISKTIINITA